MSKSLGNSPDPLDVIATYGADALRFTVLYLAPIGQDVLYSNEKCELGRNFANKVWNAGRFLLLNRQQLGIAEDRSGPPRPFVRSEDLADRWIVSRFNETARDFDAAMEAFRVNEAVKILYDFIWHDFCDWYIEFVKHRLGGSDDVSIRRDIVNRAVSLYEESLKLLHPFMPFVTEELWQHLADRGDGESISTSPWPVAATAEIDEDIERRMTFLQDVISAVRTIRSEMNVALTKDVDLVVSCHDPSQAAILQENLPALEKLARLGRVSVGMGLPKPGYAASAVVHGQEVFVPLEGVIDMAVERQRLEKEVARLEGQLKAVDSKLANPNFVGKAPDDILARERDKRENFRKTIEKLNANLAQLAD